MSARTSTNYAPSSWTGNLYLLYNLVVISTKSNDITEGRHDEGALTIDNNHHVPGKDMCVGFMIKEL
jgi:hypothetical protein